MSLYSKFNVMRSEELRGEISAQTGFDQGDIFNNPDEVRAYFRLDVMEDIFPGWRNLTGLDQTDLDDMAEAVISHGWHME